MHYLDMSTHTYLLICNPLALSEITKYVNLGNDAHVYVIINILHIMNTVLCFSYFKCHAHVVI
jgi:hypothetical protein